MDSFLYVQGLSTMARDSSGLRVLVIEDEFLVRWAIAQTLARDGHHVIEAADGVGAMRALKNAGDAIDAVLLDYRLPDSNDLTLLAEIRRLSPGSAVIVMTANDEPEIAQGALDLGAYRVLRKPFEMDGLESLLIRACASRR